MAKLHTINNPSRRPSNRIPKRHLIAFVEGRKTEEQYLNSWYRLYRDQVILEIDSFRGPPLELVKRAVKRRRGEKNSEIEVWCVFDVDEHANLLEAIDLAKVGNA